MQDNVVAVEWGRSTLSALKGAGLKNIQMKEYEGMDHTVDDEEIKHLLTFLQNCLTARGARI